MKRKKKMGFESTEKFDVDEMKSSRQVLT